MSGSRESSISCRDHAVVIQKRFSMEMIIAVVKYFRTESTDWQQASRDVSKYSLLHFPDEWLEEMESKTDLTASLQQVLFQLHSFHVVVNENSIVSIIHTLFNHLRYSTSSGCTRFTINWVNLHYFCFIICWWNFSSWNLRFICD
jgi:hypothetical protein